MIQVAYASRTGHVEKIVSKLGLTNALKIVDGTEKLEEEEDHELAQLRELLNIAMARMSKSEG